VAGRRILASPTAMCSADGSFSKGEVIVDLFLLFLAYSMNFRIGNLTKCFKLLS
jgi:hypothetical protein